MKLKKLLSLLLIICLAFSFVACGGRNTDDDDDDDRSSSSSRKNDDDEDEDKGKGKDKDKDKDKNKEKDEDEDIDEDNDKDSDKDDDDDDTGLNNSILDTFPKAELPVGYPIKDYPIYKGGRVWMALKEDQGSYYKYTVAIVYAEKFDTIINHYEGFLRDAKDYESTTTQFGNAYSGELAGHRFELFITGADNSGNPIQATIELTEIPSSGSVLKSMDEAELPAEYPVGDFPIIDGAALYNVSESESNGKVSYYLEIYTDQTIKEIIKFYEDNLTNVEDKSKSSDNNNFNISGNSNGYYFYISGYKDKVDNVELVRYNIQISPLE